MTQNERSDGLTITKLPEGGFVVSEAYHHNGMYVPFLFACTTLDEALKFVRKRITQ